MAVMAPVASRRLAYASCVPATQCPEWSWICDIADGLPGAHAADQPVWDSVVLWIGPKMFGLLCEDSRGRELLTLKLTPEDNLALRDQHECVEPGWHVNKRHWSSVVLRHPDAAPDLVGMLVEDSYECLLASLPRWRREEIRTGLPRR